MFLGVYLEKDFAASSYEHVGFLQLFQLNLQPEIESHCEVTRVKKRRLLIFILRIRKLTLAESKSF